MLENSLQVILQVLENSLQVLENFTSDGENRFHNGMADYDTLKKVMSVPDTLPFNQNVYIGGLGEP